jgi:hypothetical protein
MFVALRAFVFSGQDHIHNPGARKADAGDDGDSEVLACYKQREMAVGVVVSCHENKDTGQKGGATNYRASKRNQPKEIGTLGA